VTTEAAAVVIPVKAFSRAKARLAEVLSPAERADLSRSMATTVVGAAGPLEVVVVCDDEDVRAWAEALGVEVLWTPGLGLNGAVSAGVDHLSARGVARVVVAHADLPRATDLSVVLGGAAVTIVPDRHGDGTNVISLPTGSGFTFSYGGGSCARHVAEAERLGLGVRLLEDEALGWDVDRPEDLQPEDRAPCR
jgi:2-phospho-L-lactate guanylyltransferase